MTYLSPAKAAVSVGVVIGAWHGLWVILVATGIAGPLLDLILKLHFLEFSYSLAPFDASTAITLVGLTSGIGALMGLLFAVVWNWLSGNTQRQCSQPGRVTAGAR